MPGSVANASPSGVLPKILAKQFTRISEYPVLENVYRNGEFQSGAQSTNPRLRWRFSGKWTNAVRQAFRAFWVARDGPLSPFYMYDPWLAVPIFSHDPTGVSSDGRYIVRFEGPWSDALELGLSGAALELVEVA